MKAADFDAFIHKFHRGDGGKKKYGMNLADYFSLLTGQKIASILCGRTALTGAVGEK